MGLTVGLAASPLAVAAPWGNPPSAFGTPAELEAEAEAKAGGSGSGPDAALLPRFAPQMRLEELLQLTNYGGQFTHIPSPSHRFTFLKMK